jgi:hypothetical protein
MFGAIHQQIAPNVLVELSERSSICNCVEPILATRGHQGSVNTNSAISCGKWA